MVVVVVVVVNQLVTLQRFNIFLNEHKEEFRTKAMRICRVRKIQQVVGWCNHLLLLFPPPPPLPPPASSCSE